MLLTCMRAGLCAMTIDSSPQQKMDYKPIVEILVSREVRGIEERVTKWRFGISTIPKRSRSLTQICGLTTGFRTYRALIGLKALGVQFSAFGVRLSSQKILA
jgi:hypothetical protein